MGIKFQLKTSHSGLEYLFEKQNLNARQTRWLEFLCEFVIDIKHIKGKRNTIVDALIRRVHAMHATTINKSKLYLRTRFLKVFISYEYYLQVKEGLQQENLHKKYEGYRLEDDGIFTHKNKIYFPNVADLRRTIMDEIDKIPYFGHSGYQKMIATTQEAIFLVKNEKMAFLCIFLSVCNVNK